MEKARKGNNQPFIASTLGRDFQNDIVHQRDLLLGKPMKESAAIGVGLAVAGIIPAAVLGSLWPLSGDHTIRSVAVSILIALPFSAVFAVLFGLPAFLLLRPFRPGHWWSVSLVGCFLGILVSLAMRLPNNIDPHDFIINCPLGALSALSFWLIWRRSVAEVMPKTVTTSD
jgi:hypothetical protein